MSDQNGTSVIDDFRTVVRDGIDYFGSVVALLQARLTQYALSTILFFLLIAFSSLLLIAAFVFFNIAVGMGLARWTGNPTWAILILGGFYFVLAAVLGAVALSWVRRLKS